MSPALLARYAVFGEALTDMIRGTDGRWLDRPGGSCWNVARVGARLGIATGCATAVSQDYFGDAIVRASRDDGLDLRYLQSHARSPLLAMVTSTQPPEYQFVGDDSADLHFDPARLPSGWLDAAEVLHFGGISLARPRLAATLLPIADAAFEAGKAIAFDPNWRRPMADPAYRPVFEHLLRRAAFLKFSDDDLQALYPGLDESAAVAVIRAQAPTAALMITRGVRGMTVFDGAAVVEQPAFTVPVVDTVGCGDAAMGCWIATRLAVPNASLAQQAARAAAAAAVVAGHAGAYAPTPADIDRLIAGRG